MSPTGGRLPKVVVYSVAPGRHLLIDPSYVEHTEAVRAAAVDTCFTGGDGELGCTAWVAAVEGAVGRRAHDGRLRAELTIGVDSASIVLLDAQGLDALEAVPRLDVGQYVEVEAPHGAELHMRDDDAGVSFTLDVHGPGGRVVQHDHRPEADA